jgi:hypothetical protein
VLSGPDAEDLVDEALPDVSDTGEVDLDFGEVVHALEDSASLAARDEGGTDAEEFHTGSSSGELVAAWCAVEGICPAAASWRSPFCENPTSAASLLMLTGWLGTG